MYQIKGLQKYPGLYHAISTKDEGNMANAILGRTFDFEKILENRNRFLAKIQINPESVICMWVEGMDGVDLANPDMAGKSLKDYKKAVKKDALITKMKGLNLFLLTADCSPVILYDPIKACLGLVHVGWKGADLDIVGKSIYKLKDIYGLDPGGLVVGIGPAARKDSFIKDHPSQKDDPKWQPFLEKITNNRYKIDFVGLLKKQLLDSGVKIKNIFDCGIDTVKDERFFSHVREGKLSLEKQGRFATVVGLV